MHICLRYESKDLKDTLCNLTLDHTGCSYDKNNQQCFYEELNPRHGVHDSLFTDLSRLI